MTYIPIIMRRETVKLELNEIYYIEQNLRKTRFITETNVYENYSKISDYVIYLGENFLKCHRSLYVNLDNVVAMGDQKITFKNKSTISLGRDKFTAAKQHFSRYIISN